MTASGAAIENGAADQTCQKQRRNTALQSGEVGDDKMSDISGMPESPILEQLYTPADVAPLWRFSKEKIRRLFQNEPGVIVVQAPVKKGKRPYKNIRIPHSVLERVRARLQR